MYEDIVVIGKRNNAKAALQHNINHSVEIDGVTLSFERRNLFHE